MRRSARCEPQPNGLNLPASPVNIAINPSQRIGYVLVTPALTELQLAVLTLPRRWAVRRP